MGIFDYQSVTNKVMNNSNFSNEGNSQPAVNNPQPTQVNVIPQNQQQTYVRVSLNNILNKLYKDVNPTSINKYRAGSIKFEDRFAKNTEKKVDEVVKTANSLLSFLPQNKSNDYGIEITKQDEVSWEIYRENFNKLSADEKRALPSLLTPEVLKQMSKGEETLLKELLDNYMNTSEIDRMNPFAF